MAHTRVAGGDIYPARFVRLDPSADGKVLAAGAGGLVWGISQPGTRMPPFDGLDDGKAAIAGENVRVFGPGEDQRCMLEIGADVTRGQLLKSDTNSKGVPVSANNDVYGAVALASGKAGDLIEVEIRIGYYGA
ncbi:hypothetical protein [Tuwongella immobilis]|uniref:Uncharacterized protein n=1 Tax=Tuwongella immobilis TaxID=692036 RepID=A0A6C2YKR7_9BACT|nr:hypothetical protein [Tuwongella immobilis]VIP02170.1 unnamed protein product [Tuwongella immobilis]VIP05601.1 unnamed protein product [Tuwongella immobilis]VTS00597.1 unnamed protein product [Tuwongella immobilis]VTS08557.1 unnamed protein product [Tuwongella immobilis]